MPEWLFYILLLSAVVWMLHHNQNRPKTPQQIVQQYQFYKDRIAVLERRLNDPEDLASQPGELRKIVEGQLSEAREICRTMHG